MNDASWVASIMEKSTLTSGFEVKALQAIGEYENAKIRFTEAKAAHIAKALANHGNVRPEDAEFTSSADNAVKKAVGDAAFYNSEARMYMAAVMMLRSPSGYTPAA